MSRDVLTRLAAGFTCHQGTVALALLGLPRLDAALADAPVVATPLARVPRPVESPSDACLPASA